MLPHSAPIEHNSYVLPAHIGCHAKMTIKPWLCLDVSLQQYCGGYRTETENRGFCQNSGEPKSRFFGDTWAVLTKAILDRSFRTQLIRNGGALNPRLNIKEQTIPIRILVSYPHATLQVQQLLMGSLHITQEIKGRSRRRGGYGREWRGGSSNAHCNTAAFN